MIPVLKNHIQIYFILLNLIIAIIYFMAILIIIMSYKIRNGKMKILWPILFLKFCLPIFSELFYGQIFLLLTTIFDCQDGFSYVSQDLVCRSGQWFSIETPLTIIAIILHAVMALMKNTLYYKSIYVQKGSDVLKKTNCNCDLAFLITKIFVNLIFILEDKSEDSQWVILFFLILFTGFNLNCAFYYQSRQNKQLDFLNKILSLLPFLGFFSLFVGKIFIFLGFNGAIFMFFSWVILGIIFIFFYRKKEIDFVSINYKEIENTEKFISYINTFYEIIINREFCRKDYIILKSLISKREENCFDSQCPLKKYETLSREDNIFPLLQYCERLFEFGISKFPEDISLKVNYSMFLIFEMNQNKKALIILNNLHTSIF